MVTMTLKRIQPASVVVIVFALACCTVSTKRGKTMNTIAQQKIAQTVQAELAWKADEIRIDEVESLRRGSCSFFTAAQTKRPIALMPNFVVLKGDDVMGAGDESLNRIVATCGAEASAEWLAEVVVRFHPQLAGSLVVDKEAGFHGAIRVIEKAGKAFMVPVLEQKTLRFFCVSVEDMQVHQVEATVRASEQVGVVVNRL